VASACGRGYGGERKRDGWVRDKFGGIGGKIIEPGCKKLQKFV
jgi:hypothetical protein